jgi:hypothetical protein
LRDLELPALANIEFSNTVQQLGDKQDEIRCKQEAETVEYLLGMFSDIPWYDHLDSFLDLSSVVLRKIKLSCNRTLLSFACGAVDRFLVLVPG